MVAAKTEMGRCLLIKKFISSDTDSTEANRATQVSWRYMNGHSASSYEIWHDLR